MSQVIMCDHCDKRIEDYENRWDVTRNSVVRNPIRLHLCDPCGTNLFESKLPRGIRSEGTTL